MAVTPHPFELTDLATAKEHIGIPTGSTSFDDVVQRFINQATEKIEKMTGRRLKQRTGIAEYQDGLGNNRILLDEWPAVKPTELWIDSTSDFTDVTKKLTTDQYELELSSRGEGIGIVLVGGSNCHRLFPKGTRNIKIVYDGGYATVPDDLEGACLWMVEFFYQQRSDNSVTVMVKGKNQENTTFREHLPMLHKETIDAYTRFEIPTGNRAVVTL